MKINWKSIEMLPANGQVMRAGHFAGYGSATIRMMHVAAGQFTREMLLAETITPGTFEKTLWRRIRKTDGKWSNAQALAGEITHYAETN